MKPAMVERLTFVHDDGGRAAAGFKGSAGDCAARAIAIAAGIPYAEAYERLNAAAARERPGAAKRRRGRTGKPRRSSARDGVFKPTMRRVMADLGFAWHPTMQIGSGCTVHLHDGELPTGRLVLSLSRHFCAVIDGEIRDTHDPRTEFHYVRSGDGSAVGGPREMRPGEWRNVNGICGVSRRCVYGYWRKEG